MIEAPEELTELSPFLFAQHGGDERVLQDAVDNLRVGLAQLDLDGTRQERAWIPDALTVDAVLGLGPEESDPADCVSAGLLGRTAFGPEDHAEFAISGDQMAAEPTATDYSRTFLEPEDPSCFPGQVCGMLVTVNDVRRENALYAVRFDLHKDYRWVGDDALIARSWLDRVYPGEAGNTALLQSYVVDVVLIQDEGEFLRFQVVWGQVDLGLDVADDTSRAIMRQAVDALIEQTDEAIADQLN